MKEWPDLVPPKEMIARQPYLPRFMAGGETNPLGARAMYWAIRIPDSRHQSAIHDWQLRVLWLCSSDQGGCRGPLQAGDGGHPRHCTAGSEYGDVAIAAEA